MTDTWRQNGEEVQKLWVSDNQDSVDRWTELIKQYHSVHAMHADAHCKSVCIVHQMWIHKL